MSASIQVPYRLSFEHSEHDGAGRAALKPGRGEAGWTVAGFATLADAHAWAAQHQAAAMPCWKRPECWGGRELGGSMARAGGAQ